MTVSIWVDDVETRRCRLKEGHQRLRLHASEFPYDIANGQTLPISIDKGVSLEVERGTVGVVWTYMDTSLELFGNRVQLTRRDVRTTYVVKDQPWIRLNVYNDALVGHEPVSTETVEPRTAPSALVLGTGFLFRNLYTDTATRWDSVIIVDESEILTGVRSHVHFDVSHFTTPGETSPGLYLGTKPVTYVLDLDDYVDHIFVEIRKPLLTYTVWWTTNLHQYHKHTYVGSNGVLAWPRASLRQVLFEIDEPVTGIHLRGAATIDPHKLYLIDQSQRVKPLTRHTAQIPPANVFNLAAQNPVTRQLRPPTPSRHEYDMTRITASGRLYDRVGSTLPKTGRREIRRRLLHRRRRPG